MRKNGRMGDWAYSPMFLFLVVLIWIVVVIGVHSYFGKPYDVRQREADILGREIRDCFSEKDFFDSSFALESCGLSSKVLETNYFIEIVGDGEEYRYGEAGLKEECSFGENIENLQTPKCVSFSEGKYEFLIASNQIGRSITYGDN